MKYLSSDDVLGLEKFLVDDNDEAIGIEVHLGIRICNHKFTEPETIKIFSIEELANGDLIEIPDRTLCALVGDRIYYRDRYNNVGHISPESSFGYDCDSTKRHLVVRVKVCFDDQIVILPDSYDVKTQDGLTLYIKTSTMLGIETDRVFMGENAYSEKAWECTFDKSSLSVIMGKSANGVNDPNGVFLFGSPDNNGEAILYRGNIVDSAPSGRMTLKYVNGNTCEVIINGSDVKTISETDWAGRKVK